MVISQFSMKTKAIYTLYKANLINNNGLIKAFQDNIISQEEYDFILES